MAVFFRETDTVIVDLTTNSVDYVLFAIHCVQGFRNIEMLDSDDFLRDYNATLNHIDGPPNFVEFVVGPSLIADLDMRVPGTLTLQIHEIGIEMTVDDEYEADQDMSEDDTDDYDLEDDRSTSASD